MEAFGMWMFLSILVAAPWLFRWQKERERQKSIRSFTKPDGTIAPEVLEFFSTIQIEELQNRKKPWIQIDTIEHAVGWVVIGLSSTLGFLVFCLGFPIAKLESGRWDLTILSVTTILTLVLWCVGVYGGYKIYKRGPRPKPFRRATTPSGLCSSCCSRYSPPIQWPRGSAWRSGRWPLPARYCP
jgi:4-amino-4-deoxy-L-arabinose transferase-like glycosyltransferase